MPDGEKQKAEARDGESRASAPAREIRAVANRSNVKQKTYNSKTRKREGDRG